MDIDIFLPHVRFLQNNCFLCGKNAETLIPFRPPSHLEITRYFFKISEIPGDSRLCILCNEFNEELINWDYKGFRLRFED